MPTIIKLLLNKDSHNFIKDYLEQEKVPSEKDKFYSTLWYSLTPIFKREEMLENIGDCLPLEISPPYSFDIFSPSLVLKYANETRTLLRAVIRRECVRQSIKEWPDLEEGGRNMLEKSLAVIEDYNPETDTAEVCLIGSGEKKRIYFSTKPHVTLVKNFDSKMLGGLNKFEERLVFDDFSWKLKN